MFHPLMFPPYLICFLFHRGRVLAAFFAFNRTRVKQPMVKILFLFLVIENPNNTVLQMQPINLKVFRMSINIYEILW
jgi:hypothetical protein